VIDSSRGIIGTDWVRSRDGAVSAKYRFNFLVSEDTPGAVTVSVSIKGNWTADSGYNVDEPSGYVIDAPPGEVTLCLKKELASHITPDTMSVYI